MVPPPLVFRSNYNSSFVLTRAFLNIHIISCNDTHFKIVSCADVPKAGLGKKEKGEGTSGDYCHISVAH